MKSYQNHTLEMDAGNKSLRNTLEDIITIRFTTQAETPGFRVHRHPEQILIHSATQAETARRISAHDGSGISIHSATQAETAKLHKNSSIKYTVQPISVSFLTYYTVNQIVI